LPRHPADRCACDYKTADKREKSDASSPTVRIDHFIIGSSRIERIRLRDEEAAEDKK